MDLLLALLALCSALSPTVPSTPGKYFHILKTCQFVGTGSQYHVQYKIQYHYGGRMQALYNSSTERVVGFTRYGSQFADGANKDSNYLQHRRNDLNFYCRVKGALLYEHMQGKTAVSPVARLRSEGAGDSRLLVCSAYDFYPRQIRLSWWKDGSSVPETSGLVTTAMPSSDWRYQIHSYLELPAKAGQDVTCVVEHPGLQEPMVLQLEQSDLESEVVHSALGVSALLLGALVLVSGGIFYWRRATRSYFPPSPSPWRHGDTELSSLTGGLPSTQSMLG